MVEYIASTLVLQGILECVVLYVQYMCGRFQTPETAIAVATGDLRSPEYTYFILQHKPFSENIVATGYSGGSATIRRQK